MHDKPRDLDEVSMKLDEATLSIPAAYMEFCH
jgi:hypothetical protein